MNSLTPAYRILLNKNLLVYPQFILFLQQEFHNLLVNAIVQGHFNLEEKYKFTVYSLPVQWGNYIISKIKINESLPPEKQDKKLIQLGEILHQLDPMNPQPVDLEFELGQIVTFVSNNVKHYQELTVGGVVDYFGIETQTWFDDYPIQTGTVLRAVDYGTLNNKPLHLFDSVFMVLRNSLMDLFTVFINDIKQPETTFMVTNNVDV